MPGKRRERNGKFLPFNIRFTEEQKELIAGAANAKGLSITAFIREAAIVAARKEEKIS